MVAVITPMDPIARDEKFCFWLSDQGIEPNETYRIEINDDKAKVFQYKIETGKKFVVCDTCGKRMAGVSSADHSTVCSGQATAATKEPFEIKIKGPIPGITEVD